MKYRAEIDGLRALAVIPVLLFHAGFSYFSGGYIGVDVFFVISGYLITSIIIESLDRGKFSFADFYERRARRILPALYFVMFVSLPFAWAWMTPDYLENFSQSLVATSTFANNILLMITTGYFDDAVEYKPLLHTWSLSVEEQYYVFYPLLMIALWKWAGVNKVVILGLLAALSLGIAQWSYNQNFDGYFYSSLSRAWELLIGALAVFFLKRDVVFSRHTCELLSIIGLILILVGIALFDKSTPFPSLYTLVPVVGTVLIILFAQANTFVNKLLSMRIIVGIGLISYSVYLWHQPLFAFARIRMLSAPDTPTYFALIILSIVLGYLTWRYIEAPFRDKTFLSRSQVFVSSALVGGLLIVLGLFGHFNEGFSDRVPSWAHSAINPKKSNWSLLNNCNNPIQSFPDISICKLGSDKSDFKIALWGDSHAEAIVSAFDNKLKELEISGGFIRNKYCGAIAGISTTKDINDVSRCERSQDALIAYLKTLDLQDIIILNRWTLQTLPVDGIDESSFFDNHEGGVEAFPDMQTYTLNNAGVFTTNYKDKSKAVIKFIERFSDSGAQVVVIGAIPEVGWDVSQYNMKVILQTGRIPEFISTSYNRYLERNQFIINTLSDINNKLVHVVDPALIFCNNELVGRCVAQVEKTPLYYDNDHLSMAGANLLIEDVFNVIPNNQK